MPFTSHGKKLFLSGGGGSASTVSKSTRLPIPRIYATLVSGDIVCQSSPESSCVSDAAAATADQPTNPITKSHTPHVQNRRSLCILCLLIAGGVRHRLYCHGWQCCSRTCGASSTRSHSTRSPTFHVPGSAIVNTSPASVVRVVVPVRPSTAVIVATTPVALASSAFGPVAK